VVKCPDAITCPACAKAPLAKAKQTAQPTAKNCVKKDIKFEFGRGKSGFKGIGKGSYSSNHTYFEVIQDEISIKNSEDIALFLT